MKLTHALAILSHARTLENVGTLSSTMSKQIDLHEKNIATLKAARKAVTLSGRRIRELAAIATAVYPEGSFKSVSAPKKIPAQRKVVATPAKSQGQASVGVTG